MSEGAYFAFGLCWSCHEPIAFDPGRVPSMPIRIDGAPAQHPAEIDRREPLCLDCVRLANVERRANGLPTWSEDPTAYEVVRGMPE